jgi:hypothetical protein
MRIVFAGFELSAGGKGSPAGLSVGGSKQVQTVLPTRATEGTVYDRGNKVYVLSWEQEREFATVGEAESFMLLHGANVPDGRGDCTIITEAGASIHLTGAVLQVPQAVRQQGVFTRHAYQLTATGLSGEVPPSLSTGAGPATNDAVTYNGDPVDNAGDPLFY